MLLVKETSSMKHLLYGRITVGTSATQLTIATGPCNRGVLVRAPGISESDANTDIVYVGDADVTVASGFPLLPGGVIELPVDDPSLIYVIAASSQSLAWMGV